MVTNGLKPSNFKEWLWSAKVFTTIVWILFPLGYIIIITVLDSYDYFYSEEIDALPFFRPIPIYTLETTFPNTTVTYSISIPPIPLLTILILFAVIPAALSSEKFFRKRGEVNCVFEYQYVKKILYVSLAMLIIAIVSLYYVQSYLQSYINNGKWYPEPIRTSNPILIEIVFILPAVPLSILLKLLFEHARKQFRFYYAKACFEIIMKSTNETDKLEYLGLGLDWYNKFIKRITKSSIDIQTIYSRIVSQSQLSNSIILDTTMDSFHEGDEFKPMRENR